jgi:hypothetical protein
MPSTSNNSSAPPSLEQAAQSEPRADALDRSLERAAEKVFLSPRVVDQRAYDDFAGGLQRLIREADSRAKSLDGTGEQLRKVTEQLRGLMRDLQQRTDAAGKTLPALESGVKHAQSLLERVGTGAATQAARQLRDAVVKAVEEEREGIIAAGREKIAASVRLAVEQEVEKALREARERGAWASTEQPARGADHDTLALEHTRAIASAREELDAVVESARRRVDEAVSGLERRTEAVAAELSEQLAALRRDAEQVVRSATESVRASSDTPVSHAVDAPRATEHHADAERAQRLLIDLSERVEGAAFALDAIERRAKEIVGGALGASNALAAQAGQVQQLLMHVQQTGNWLAHFHITAQSGQRSVPIGDGPSWTPMHGST